MRSGDQSEVYYRRLHYGRKPHAYRILFTIEDDAVYVLRIRHGRRRRLDESQ